MKRAGSSARLYSEYELKSVLSGDASALRRPRRGPCPVTRSPPVGDIPAEHDSPASVVFRGTRKRDRFEVAVKAVSKRSLSNAARLALAREVAVHSYVTKRRSDEEPSCVPSFVEESDRQPTDPLPAPNVAQFVEAFEDEANLYIVTELANMGDLHTHLVECHDETGLDEVHALRIMIQIFEAVADLHARNIAHRDIKLENLAISGESIATARACLIDFGLCHIRKPGSALTSKQFVGTAGYACPEICQRKAYVPQEGDMWSLGVVFYALLTKEMPFAESSSTSLPDNIVEAEVSFGGEKWAEISQSTKSLIYQLLSKNASDRPCAEDALDVADSTLNELLTARREG